MKTLQVIGNEYRMFEKISLWLISSQVSKSYYDKKKVQRLSERSTVQVNWKWGINNESLCGVKNLQMLTIPENSSKQDIIDESLLNDIVYSI